MSKLIYPKNIDDYSIISNILWSTCQICKVNINEMNNGNWKTGKSTKFLRHLEYHNINITDYFLNILKITPHKCLCGCGEYTKINLLTKDIIGWNKRIVGHINNIDGTNKRRKKTIFKNKTSIGDFFIICQDSDTIVKSKSLRYWCICSCDKIVSKSHYELEICNRCNHKKYDLTGKIFFNVKVISQDGYYLYRNSKIKLWKIQCLKCGTIKTVRGGGLKSGHIQTCGKKSCAKRGKEHHAFKADKVEPRRKTSEYMNWINGVLKRCKFKCLVCDINKNLECHHLDAWSWCKERRFEIENGISLCKSHHYEFHKLYGRHKNTREQFVEYLSALFLKLPE